jgi:hypothetical protein
VDCVGLSWAAVDKIHTELWFHPWFQQNWGAIAQVWGTLGFRGPRKRKMVGFAVEHEVEWGISENPRIWVLPNCCPTTVNIIFQLHTRSPIHERKNRHFTFVNNMPAHDLPTPTSHHGSTQQPLTRT